MKLLNFIALITVAASHSQWFDYITPNQLVKYGDQVQVVCRGEGPSMSIVAQKYDRNGMSMSYQRYSNSTYQWEVRYTRVYSNFTVICKMLYTGGAVRYEGTIKVNYTKFENPRHMFLTENQTVPDGTRVTFYCHGKGEYFEWSVRSIKYPHNHPFIKNYSSKTFQNTTLSIYVTKATDGYWIQCTIYAYYRLKEHGPMNELSKTSYIFVEEEGSGTQPPIYPSHPPTRVTPPIPKHPTVPSQPPKDKNDNGLAGGYFALLWNILAQSKDVKITH